ncbi:hypothetical protein H0H93_010699 [Arthromyces matolae]|nr:hypothetical protein H0H93_010699 [Arthromyces matolae]
MDPREPDEHASLLPNGHGHGPSSSPVSDPHLSHERIGPLLYTSHFLSTWNSRMFEFGAILFLTSIFTGTLLPTSSYALVRTCAAILGSPAVGRYIDDNLHRRLRVVRVSIVSQRLAVVLSCMLFGLLFLLKSDKDSIFLLNFPPTGLKKLLHNNKDIISVVSLGFLALLACVEKLGSVMNTVSVERDWVRDHPSQPAFDEAHTHAAYSL